MASGKAEGMVPPPKLSKRAFVAAGRAGSDSTTPRCCRHPAHCLCGQGVAPVVT